MDKYKMSKGFVMYVQYEHNHYASHCFFTSALLARKPYERTQYNPIVWRHDAFLTLSCSNIAAQETPLV